MKQDQKILNAIIRTDFNSFLAKSFHTLSPGVMFHDNWHIELIARYLKEVENGNIKRLIINIPPRSLKSVCIAVSWPAWILGHDPTKRIIAASYSQMLSVKHSLDTRFVMESNWYKKAFPDTILSKTQNQKSKFLTTCNGLRFATSVGGSITGEGADILILDDPHNPSHVHSSKLRDKSINWFEQSFISRLNDKNKGAIIIVMQRLHADDLTGYLLSSKTHWELVKIPIMANQDLRYKVQDFEFCYKKDQLLHMGRDNMKQLLQLENEIGTLNYISQYLQEPVKNDFSLVKASDLHFCDDLPNDFEYFVFSLDSAIKISENSDYSVCTIWGIKKDIYYLVNMLRQKLTYPELKESILKVREKYLPKLILIEDKASGQQLIQELKLELNNIISIMPKFDKVTRFASVAHMFGSGQVKIANKNRNLIIDEISQFPNAKHDDIVDSISQFLIFMQNKKRILPRIHNI